MLTRSRLLVLAIAPVGLASLLPVPALPKSTGILPGELFVPPNVTSAFPACGQCHNTQPNANGHVTVALTPFARVLDAGAKALEMAQRHGVAKATAIRYMPPGLTPAINRTMKISLLKGNKSISIPQVVRPK